MCDSWLSLLLAVVACCCRCCLLFLPVLLHMHVCLMEVTRNSVGEGLEGSLCVDSGAARSVQLNLVNLGSALQAGPPKIFRLRLFFYLSAPLLRASGGSRTWDIAVSNPENNRLPMRSRNVVNCDENRMSACVSPGRDLPRRRKKF